MMPDERRKRMLEMIDERGLVSLTELERTFSGVSTMTLRRDLRYLDEHGKAIRVRHGARATGRKSFGGDVEPSYAMRASHNIPSKDAIALAALGLIDTERSIFLDAGSTLMRMALHLPDGGYAITTHAPNIAQELVKRQHAQVFLLGGTLHRESLANIGPHALEMLGRMNIDTAIMSTGGYAQGEGFSCGNQGECEIKRLAMSKARRCVMLMDQDKLARSLPFTFANLEDVHDLILDGPIESPQAASLAEAAGAMGINVIVAPVPRERSKA